VKRFIFYAMDQYTIKVLCRKEWEAGVQHGIACEQQRIMKLLDKLWYPQTKAVYEIDETQQAIAIGQVHQYRRELAALIKGEK